MIKSLINKFSLKLDSYSEKNIIGETRPINKPIDLSILLDKIKEELYFDSKKDFDKVAMAVSRSKHMKYKFNNRLIYHSYKVGLIGAKLTRNLKFKNPSKYSSLKKREIRDAGFLHDIGHLVSPIDIYFKKNKLSEKDKEILAQHMQYGEIILSILGIKNSTVVNAAMFHHEKMDGSGHFNLSGRGIPLVARIIAVADIYDALRSEREYKLGLTHNETFEIMYNENMMKVYDSDILNAMKYMSPKINFFYDLRFQKKLELFK
ncbi:MAG: HD domain-containing protein [Candidatus Woesearchaeota archaeon]|jgi:HD-GYP domain-containing protein (c-di-GMP phosphodiesterase class II)|nr:HD domain-containing protein [Candidatus Woesearchaeota archaeon]